jgi:GT2 family glycosyltransferase
MNEAPHAVTVVLLAYGPEPYLQDAVDAVLRSTGVSVELVLVDNGCTSDAVTDLPADPRVRILRPETNLGFTGGVNLGARFGGADTIVLVNSDALVAPDAIAELTRALDDPAVGIVSGCVRLAVDPTRVNSVGNPLHVLGLSWAGGMGDAVADHAEGGPVASATGAFLALRRTVWDDLQGFPHEYFAYLEDLELSWRCWQTGRRVEYVPTAVADHFYEFNRSKLKMFLVERNRLLFLATCHEARTLLLLAPVLIAFECALAVVAARQGWLAQKVRSWCWFVGHAGWIHRRRRFVQERRSVADRDLVWLMTDTFDPATLAIPYGGDLLQRAFRQYWRAVKRLA